MAILKRLVGDGTDKRKNARYDVVLRVKGKQIWKTFKTETAAKVYVEETCPDIRDGSWKKLKDATFGEYAEQWKGTFLIAGTVDENGNLDQKRLKPSTIRGYRTIVDAYLIPQFEHIPLQAIDAGRIIAFESKLLQREKFSNKSVHNALTLLGRILEDARKAGYLKVSPMIDVEKTQFTCKKGRALKADEAQKLLAKCSGYLKTMVMVMLLAGLRRAEVLGLKWTDIDFDNDVIHVRRSLEWLSRKHGQVAEDQNAFVFQPPKYHSIRKVDMSPLLKAELRAMRLRSEDKEGLIFQTAKSTPMQPSNVYRREFKPAVEAAEIGKVKIHDLRHTFGSWKIEQGENVVYVSRQMGHKDASITLKVYSHLIKEQRPEAAAKTDAMLFQPTPQAQAASASSSVN